MSIDRALVSNGSQNELPEKIVFATSLLVTCYQGFQLLSNPNEPPNKWGLIGTLTVTFSASLLGLLRTWQHTKDNSAPLDKTGITLMNDQSNLLGLSKKVREIHSSLGLKAAEGLLFQASEQPLLLFNEILLHKDQELQQLRNTSTDSNDKSEAIKTKKALTKALFEIESLKKTSQEQLLTIEIYKNQSIQLLAQIKKASSSPYDSSFGSLNSSTNNSPIKLPTLPKNTDHGQSSSVMFVNGKNE